jgi:hypothetical protein
MALRQAHPEHIQPHRLWAYICLESDLHPFEHAHMKGCEVCMDTMRLCLRAPTFGAVLRELARLKEE